MARISPWPEGTGLWRKRESQFTEDLIRSCRLKECSSILPSWLWNIGFKILLDILASSPWLPQGHAVQPVLDKSIDMFVSKNPSVTSSSKHADTFNFYIGSWLISFILVGVSYQLLFSLSSFSWDDWSKIIYRSVVSLFFCLLIVLAALALDQSKKHLFKYVLFFSITITSAFGLTKTLTGSHAESDNIILYGFSFYTASIAYLLHSKRLSAKSIAAVSNPLLLITGPIATCFRSIRHYSFKKRFKYFFPYILVGLFLHQAIATPLTKAFHLIALTDMISSCAFAVIFELFVYANFCGLSLLIYGVCGIIGVRVPLNFRQPFSSTNIVEYWRAWHTSLSIVLKVSILYSNKAFFRNISCDIARVPSVSNVARRNCKFPSLGSLSRINIHFDNSILTKGSIFYSICIDDTRCSDRSSVIC